MNPDNEKLSLDKGIQIAYYSVCVIDVLGQSVKLAGWSKLPKERKATPEFLRAIKETAGTVNSVKKAFALYFQQFENRSLPPWVTTSDQRALLERWRHCTLGSQQFSDTFVFFSPLMNAHSDLSLEGMYRMITACCMIMVASLATGIALRGSICLGTGLELEKGNFYGPALATAHHLESKVANYPRIVVSPETAQFLSARTGFSNDRLLDALDGDLASVCQRMLLKDADNSVIIDFLGEGFRSTVGEAVSSYVQFIQAAYKFVCSEVDRFAGLSDDKHTKRYSLLRQYMEPRLRIWGAG